MKQLITSGLLLGLTVTVPVSAQVRLGDWLSEDLGRKQQLHVEEVFLPGIMWLVPDEKPAQKKLQDELIQSLDGFSKKKKSVQLKQDIEQLKSRVLQLPITGRVILPKQDPRWLQGNPRFDGILQPGHLVEYRSNPGMVSVLLSDGQQCALPHRPGAYASHYVTVCQNSAADVAWVIQADGAIQKIGLAQWNAQAQAQAGPGAWIWAPLRKDQWPTDVSEKLAQLLSTQGPSGDTAKSLPNPKDRIDNPVVLAKHQQEAPRDLPYSANDWGMVGLMQTPTARFAPAGHANFSISYVAPYHRMNMIFTPFDWLETGFRYTDIKNRLYGPAEFSGDQSYKDKSIDIKGRLLKESAYMPQVALGITDLAGTGLFSSEYLVANKRWGSFDWSLGLAWGYMGGRQDFSNPIGKFKESYNTRTAPEVGQGGQFSFSTYFSGPMALFGGVQYHTPWNDWVVKVELDGNNYEREPKANNQIQKSPINIGLVKSWSNVDLTLGFERGHQAMINFSFHGNMAEAQMPKLSMPAKLPVSLSAPLKGPETALQRSALIQDIEAQTGWRISKIDEYGDTWVVEVYSAQGFYINELATRVLSVLHRDAPEKIKHFRLAYYANGIYITEQKINRAQYVLNETQLVPPSQQAPTIVQDLAGVPWKEQAPQLSITPAQVATQKVKPHGGGFGLAYSHILGGPDGFYFYNISARVGGYTDLWKGAWVGGSLDYKLLNNLDGYSTGGSSQLPRVRTYLKEYATEEGVTIPRLRAVQNAKISDNQYAAVYGGLLESYFGGVGAEWLYKKTGASWAVGVDINKVRQRTFEQQFDFMDYKVNTGHLSVYWDTPWDRLSVKASAGQYLAGDRGATLNLYKVFSNGATIGAYMTKTNVSAQQFGEGSFDKGIYFSMPFDAMLTKNTSGVASFMWKPITRDGGAMLDRGVSLLGTAGMRDPRTLDYSAPNLPKQ